MNNHRHRAFFLRSSSALSILFTTAMAAPAVAQSASSSTDAKAGDPSEIVVTASRRDTTVLETPINISAIGGADLEKAGTSDFSALARTVPGLVYTATSVRNGGATNSFIIHGLNLDDATATGDRPGPTLPPVSTYVNETAAFVNLRLMDVKRVEVLRGPQATLYGLSSIGGTVRVLLNEPDLNESALKLDTQLSQTKKAGSPNYAFDAVANQPLSEQIGFRVAAGYVKQAGFIDAKNLFQLDANGIPVLANPSDPIGSLPVSRSKRDINKAEVYYIRPSILYEIDDLRLFLTYHHQHEKANANNFDDFPGTTGPTSYSPTISPNILNPGFDAAFPAVFDEYERGTFLAEPYRRTAHLASLEASYDFGFATLTSITSWYQNEGDGTQDVSAPYQKSLAPFYAGYPRLSVSSRGLTEDTGTIQEIRLVSNGDRRLSYLVGVFYLDQKTSIDQQDIIPGFSQFAAALGFPSTDVAANFKRSIQLKELAAYGEMTYKVTDKWQITVGVRYFNQKFDGSVVSQLPICGIFCGTDALGTSSGESKTSKSSALFKVNTSYQISPKMLVFGTFSQGQRRGGANSVPQSGPFGVPAIFNFFSEDKVNNFEIGLKGRLGSVLDFSASLYWVDWQDPQVNIVTPIGFLPAVVNGSKARSRGIDLESRVSLTPEFTLAANYSYNDAELTRDVEKAGFVFGRSGGRLPGSPRHQASITGTYERSIFDDNLLTVQAGVNYRGSIVTELLPINGVTLPSFWMANASIGISNEKWRVTLFAENITNARGVVSARSTLIYDQRGIANQLQTPATVGIRLGYNY